MIIENESGISSLQEAKKILEYALNFVRQSNIRAMYKSNKYLAARQWDIIRDLIKVNCLLKNKVDALNYLEQLSTSSSGLYWVSEDKDIVSFLSQHPKFNRIVAKEKAWNRVQSTTQFKSKYQQNISDTEKLAGLSLLWSVCSGLS